MTSEPNVTFIFLKGHIFPLRIVIRSRCSFGQVSTINIQNLISSFIWRFSNVKFVSMEEWREKFSNQFGQMDGQLELDN